MCFDSARFYGTCANRPLYVKVVVFHVFHKKQVLKQRREPKLSAEQIDHARKLTEDVASRRCVADLLNVGRVTPTGRWVRGRQHTLSSAKSAGVENQSLSRNSPLRAKCDKAIYCPIEARRFQSRDIRIPTLTDKTAETSIVVRSNFARAVGRWTNVIAHVSLARRARQLDQCLLRFGQRFDILGYFRDTNTEKSRKAFAISKDPSFSFVNRNTDQ